jgi:hypothetical protein
MPSRKHITVFFLLLNVPCAIVDTERNLCQSTCLYSRQPFLDFSPSSKLGLDTNSVIHRGLNSLFAAKISFSGLH